MRLGPDCEGWTKARMDWVTIKNEHMVHSNMGREGYDNVTIVMGMDLNL